RMRHPSLPLQVTAMRQDGLSTHPRRCRTSCAHVRCLCQSNSASKSALLKIGFVRFEELLGGVLRNDVPHLVPVHESDDNVLVLMTPLPLDPDHGDLVQVDDGIIVAAPLVTQQLERTWHGSPRLRYGLDSSQ